MSRRRVGIFLFALSLAIRLVWLETYPKVIENEGTQYARLAENLLSHHGYVDMRGPVTMVSPLYSILIAGISILTGNAELAGRLISLLAGAMLPVLIFLITEKVYGMRPGVAGGLLTSLHAALIAFSAAVYSEILYETLLMAALYYVLITLEGKGYLAPLCSGAFAGLAYLARPEGLLYACVFAAWIVAATWMTRRRLQINLARPVALMAVSVLLALPFMAFITWKTGRLSWEGKSSVNDNIVMRMHAGMTYQQANTGLGPNLREDGVALENDQFSYARTHPVPIPIKLRLFTNGWVTRFLGLSRSFRWAQFLGSPFLWILAAIGLASGPWNRLRVAHEVLLSVMAFLSIIVLSTLYFLWSRFLLALLPFALIWAGHGAASLYEWLDRKLAVKWHDSPMLRQFAALIVPVTLSFCLLLASAQGVLELGEITQGRRVEAKTAGRWIASHFPAATVLTIGMVTPYYAGALARVLPYTDDASAAAYLHLKNPDLIILRGDEERQRPYLSAWLRTGIPDPCARLAYRVGDQLERSVVVYQWTCR